MTLELYLTGAIVLLTIGFWAVGRLPEYLVALLFFVLVAWPGLPGRQYGKPWRGGQSRILAIPITIGRAGMASRTTSPTGIHRGLQVSLKVCS